MLEVVMAGMSFYTRCNRKGAQRMQSFSLLIGSVTPRKTVRGVIEC